MAGNIPDDKLLEYGHRLKGQTVIITGAAKGLGRQAAITFGRCGGNIVIGDIDVEGVKETVAEIKKAGGNAVSTACNVLDYNQLVSLFELALSKFGRIDVVVANAGVTEIGKLTEVKLNEKGLPIKPNLKTVEIDLISVLYTTQLASHYLAQNKSPGSLKALVLIGSMASISGVNGAPLYGSAKQGVLALMSSIKDEFESQGLRVATVCPFFADTAIVPPEIRVLLAGIPFLSLSKIAATFVLAATNGAPDANGSAYLLPDEREVFRIPRAYLNEGMYKLIDNRVKREPRFGQTLITFAALLKIFVSLPPMKLLISGAIGYKAYRLAVLKGLL